MQRVLMTGAAGRIGTVLRSKLGNSSLSLRVCDIAPPPEEQFHGGEYCV